MEQNKTDDILSRIDPYSLLTDLLRSLPGILAGAAAVFMAVVMLLGMRDSRTYTTNATFAVMSKNYSNYVNSNLSAANGMAAGFSNILQSDIMKKKICEDLGLDSFDASLSADIIQDTNLLELRVTAGSPREAYMIIRSIMNNYQDLTSYFSENTVMQVLKAPDVPTLSDNRVYIRRRGMQAGAAAFAGLLVIFALLSTGSNTIRSSRDLREKLDAKDLGEIPYARAHSAGKAALPKGGALITDVGVPFAYTEAFRRLTARVIHQAKKSDARTIVITSTAEHEGKSTIAANIALTLALQKRRVFLVDCDFRRPRQAALFNLTDKGDDHSLQSLLEGHARPSGIFFRHDLSGLYVLYTSPDQKSSPDLFTSQKMKDLIRSLTERAGAEYVIIDTPPMKAMADAETLADLADVSVLAVKYNFMDARDINDTIDSLRECRARFAGCVLNMVHTIYVPGFSAGGSGYGHYGRYGAYGKYGKYGRYSRYGNYGYGPYGRYKERRSAQEQAEEKQ